MFRGNFSNERPVYELSGGSGEGRAFSFRADACWPGWGVVNQAWLADQAGPGAGPVEAGRGVLLRYLATLDLPPAGGCLVDLWYIAPSDAPGLASSKDSGTLLAVSDAVDPSLVTSWAVFTHGTNASAAAVRGNTWVRVGCSSREGPPCSPGGGDVIV